MTMQAATKLEPQGSTSSHEILTAALAATESAMPFAAQLEKRLRAQVEKLRVGDDGTALNDLGDTTRDIGEFLTYLVLLCDCVSEIAPDVHQNVLDYRHRVMTALASLNPALSDLDLVEVADTIEEDIAGAIAQYPAIHSQLVHALQLSLA
jgi:hypothetical protein